MAAATADLLARMNVALNEASFLGLAVDMSRLAIGIELEPLRLPQEDQGQIGLRLFPIGRLAASLVERGVTTKDLTVDQLSAAVASFGGRPIYGWEFFNPPSSSLNSWLDRLSLDVPGDPRSLNHCLHLFQETRERSLDVGIWFAELASTGPRSLDDIAAAGKRWWDAVAAGDTGTAESGIHSLKRPE